MRIRIQLFTIKKADPDPVSQRDGEYNGDFVTFRTEGSMQDITATRLQSTDSPLLSLLNLMYCERVSLWIVKIFLAQH